MTDVPRETLSPGDLCVILRHNALVDWTHRYIGRTVVLIETLSYPYFPAQYCPYWRCTGLPAGVMVSHLILRKIPPDSMLDARTHIEVEPKPEELTVCPESTS